jgi:hypothetical protein
MPPQKVAALLELELLELELLELELLELELLELELLELELLELELLELELWAGAQELPPLLGVAKRSPPEREDSAARERRLAPAREPEWKEPRREELSQKETRCPLDMSG